ncbi:MAG: ABC transporter ATP-binding protein [Nitrospinota bacterium]|nr:ABC transporter ATP-binding protein [Nitrospinota bacterium]MDH5677800.1 ABC transporter ATP-binding protein [Nitrospinota bacterium]
MKGPAPIQGTAPIKGAVPLVELVDIHKSVGASAGVVKILKGISLSVCAGESIAVTGPSGSGKSTLLHVMGLLTPATHGNLKVGGELVDHDRRKAINLRRRFGFIFQDAKLINGLSALQNVQAPLMHIGVWPHRQKKLATDALEAVGMGHRLGHHPGQLSGGESMRVAIARALVAKPSILLADEPTGSLDSANGRIIADLLLGMVGRTTALVMVTHQPELARRANRIAHIIDGVLVDQ